MLVVFDTSPWIFLSKLGLIEQTVGLFNKVFIPSSVGEEISVRRDEAFNALERLRATGHVEVTQARNSRFVKALRRRLGKGEAEAIVIALEKDAEVVILDDHTARSEAMRLGLQVKGTLGIIRRLMELGEFKGDLRELYRCLGEIGFRVKENLFWQIFSGIE